MTAERWFDYYEDEECQAVALDYAERRFAMRVILPKKGVHLPSALKAVSRGEWIKQSVMRPGLLEWPGFTFNSTPPITTDLFGVPRSITIDQEVVLNAYSEEMPVDLRQETWIEANEEGTEAMGLTVARWLGVEDALPVPPPPKPFEMIVDRPFYFMIVDRYDDIVLFIGRVADPRRT